MIEWKKFRDPTWFECKWIWMTKEKKMNETYLGCPKCTSKGKDGGKIEVSGFGKVFIGQGCSIKCCYCGTALEFIEEAKQLEKK